MQRVWGTAPMRLADAGGGGGRFPAAQVRGVHSLPRSAAPSAPPCGPALAPVQCPPRWAHGLRPSHRSLWKLFFCAGQAPDQRPAAARAFPPHPRKRCCTRRAQSSACSTQAETGVPEWGGQGHGVRGKRKRRLRAPGRGRARRDLESGLGSEFREAQPDTCMFEEEKRRPRQGERLASFSGGPARGGLAARDPPTTPRGRAESKESAVRPAGGAAAPVWAPRGAEESAELQRAQVLPQQRPPPHPRPPAPAPAPAPFAPHWRGAGLRSPIPRSCPITPRESYFSLAAELTAGGRGWDRTGLAF